MKKDNCVILVRIYPYKIDFNFPPEIIFRYKRTSKKRLAERAIKKYKKMFPMTKLDDEHTYMWKRGRLSYDDFILGKFLIIKEKLSKFTNINS
jgi:hypothetical protein